MSEFRSLFRVPIEEGDFKGKEGETLFLYKKDRKENRILLVGLGSEKQCTLETIRRGYGAALKSCLQKRLRSISVALPETDFEVAYAAAEGLFLANYTFDKLKSEKDILVQKICFIDTDIKECRKAETIISAVNFARDLINGNADDITPQFLAKTAQGLASKTIKTTVLDKKALEKVGMGLLLAVARASMQGPTFIILEYRGNPRSSDVTALVGKGITYDTGGLILKPKGGMETMKDDMSGGAAVMGTIKAAAALGLKVNLIGAIPCTENAIGSKSYKPGDVYKSYSGKTVEIWDTDAEGRLVLADAVSYVQDKYKPSRIIDIATLTGGVVVALGEDTTGLFSNDDDLATSLISSGIQTHERLCRLPLYSDYKEGLKSHIADIKNSGPDRKASPIRGAIFIQEFIGKIPWAHLDIGGTAYLGAPRHYHLTPATGVGIRLLLDFLQKHEKI